MERDKKYNFSALLTTLVVFSALFIYSEYFCTGACYVAYEAKYLDPFAFMALGFAANVFLLLLFPGKVFISWIKYIAWWFLILVIVLVANTDQGGFLPLYDRVQVALFWMAVLFLITLIYAFLMNRHLQKQKTTETTPKNE